MHQGLEMFCFIFPSEELLWFVFCIIPMAVGKSKLTESSGWTRRAGQCVPLPNSLEGEYSVIVSE